MNHANMTYTCKSVHSMAKHGTIYVGLVVDAVLNSTILSEKAAELVSAWPILGGKLLKQTTPWSFTCGSTVDYASRPVNQSLATYLPLEYHHGDKPTIIQSAEIFEVDEKFIFDASLRPDTIFRLRVTILQDATLLCFGITHHLSDANSCYEAMKAFCNLLSDQPIPSFVLSPDAEGIPLSDKIKNESTEEESAAYYQTHQQNFDTGIIKLGRLAWRLISSKVAEKCGFIDEFTTKFVYLPGAWVNRLHAISQEELAVHSHGINLTRNDIIAAWLLKVTFCPQPASCEPVDFYGAINFRPFVDHPDTNTYYIHNTAGLSRCNFSVQQLQTESLTSIARDIRLTTLRYKCHASAQQNLRFVEDNISNTVAPNTRGGGSLAFVALSQWTTFNFTSLDFSGASLEGRKPSVTFVNAAATIPGNLSLGPISILQKNGLGDYWVRMANTSTAWKNFDHSSSMESLFPAQ